MTIIVLERVSPSLRGELTRWLLELKAGVFVGRVSAVVRERLWERVATGMAGGGGVLVHTADNEQGYIVRFVGSTGRDMRDFDGLQLVQQPSR